MIKIKRTDKKKKQSKKNNKKTTMPESKSYKKIKKADYFFSLIFDRIPASKITLSLSLEN